MSSLDPCAIPYIPSQNEGSEHQSETDEAGFQSEAHLGKIDSVGHITDNINDHAISTNVDADEATAIMELDLNTMSSLFPNTSRESLAGIYHANDGDLTASVEMMNELEDFGANKDLNAAPKRMKLKKKGRAKAATLQGRVHPQNRRVMVKTGTSGRASVFSLSGSISVS